MSKQQNLIGHIFNQQYQLKRKLKSGGFGSVYLGKNLKGPHKYVAVKIMDPKSKFYAQMQFKMYQKIKQNSYTYGFIKHYDQGLQNNNYFLVLQLLDKDLDQLILKTGSFSLKTVLMIGLQIIDRIQAFHKIGYLHRDIKPDNLVIGFQQKKNIVYLIDFGLAKRIKEVRPQQKGKLIGSLGYMSCRAHEGKQTGTADDVQSLVYTMLFLLNGSLPWSKLKISTIAQTHKILIMKKKLSESDFKITGIPKGLFQILNQMKSTCIDQKVDYLKIKFLIIDMLKSIKAQNDFCFDWLNFKSVSPNKKNNKAIQPQKLKKQRQIQENQKHIQKQIYEVYKFLERPQKSDGQMKQQIKSNQIKLRPQKQQKGRSNQPSQNKVYKQELKCTISKEDQSNLKRPKKSRPISALNTKINKELVNKTSTLMKMTQLYGLMKYQPPNIVINRTAKHRI